MSDQKQDNYMQGVVMIILSAFCFACMNVMVRLAGDIPSIQKSFAGVILWRAHVPLQVEKKAGLSLPQCWDM